MCLTNLLCIPMCGRSLDLVVGKLVQGASFSIIALEFSPKVVVMTDPSFYHSKLV
jgi:hypothetical protein